MKKNTATKKSLETKLQTIRALSAETLQGAVVGGASGGCTCNKACLTYIAPSH